MASKGDIQNEYKKERLINKYYYLRQELKKIVSSESVSMLERMNAAYKLDRLPKLSCPIKKRNRCIESGRARSVDRRTGLYRMNFREAVSKGEIPGISKASW